MPEIFKLILEGFKTQGWWFIFQLLLLFCIFGAIALFALWIKSKFSEPTIANTNQNLNSVQVNVNLDEKEEQHIEHTNRDLLNHPFFRSIKKYLEYDIERLDIKEPLRSRVFRDFLKYKFEIVHECIRAFILAGDMNEMSSETFHDKLHSLVTEIMQKYEAKAIIEKIPPIVIEKFNKWNSGQTDGIYKFVDNICEADDWYVLNTVKFYSFLNQYVSMLDLTLINARKTLVMLNGELDAIEYKGIKSTMAHHKRAKSDSSGFQPALFIEEFPKRKQ
jgi:hypothetical protein